MKTYDCLVLTASTIDNIIEMESTFPILGSTSRGVKANYLEPGGEGNFIIVFSRMGGSVLPVGPIGTDYYGSIVLSNFQKEGVDLSSLRKIEGYLPPIANCLVDENGVHSFVSQLNAVKFAEKEEVLKELDKCKAYFLSGYYLSDETHPYYDLALSLFEKAIADNKLVFFDSGPYVGNIKKEILDRVLPHLAAGAFNEDEAKVLTSSDSPQKALDLISERMDRGLSVVKAGKDGCYAKRKGDEAKHYKAFDVKVRDTMGCGDSFLSALMYALINSWSDYRAITLANAVGSVMASKMGTGTKGPTFSEVVEILEKNGYSVSAESKEINKFLEIK